MAALACERLDVFHAIHLKPFEWLRDGILDGLRVDHVDGLLNPTEYLLRLQQSYLMGCAQQLWEAQPGKYGVASWAEVDSELRTCLQQTWSGPGPLLYVVVEKILGPHESLPANWVCDGTTGYEFLNEVNRLFVDPVGDDAITAVYQQFTKQTDSMEQIAYEKKLLILQSTMASELHVLAHQLDRLAQTEWWSRDFTLNGLRHALEEMIANFPVYRTYVTDEPLPADRITILRAARRARRMSPLLGREVFDFICNTLLLREPPNLPLSVEYHECQRKFAEKFQQLTSPVMAKGVEDTAFYIFNRLISLNEVGGEPAKFGGTPHELHVFLQDRQSSTPYGLSPLSTHDTKRSEDVRARINVLSEMPAEWGRRIEYWRRLNRSFKVELEEGFTVPDDNEEYLLYQTLIAALPSSEQLPTIDEDFVKRIQAYMTKAIREAKINSSWIYPELEYDAAVSSFIASILNDDVSASFLADLREFQTIVHPIGRLNSLSQTLIRCIAPGVPDTYQGCDTWDYSLVDPDNRRPVDYASRTEMLEELDSHNIIQPEKRLDQIRQDFRSDKAKLLVTAKGLRLRRQHSGLFRTGKYIPLDAHGIDSEHLFGFIIAGVNDAVLVAVPRLMGGLFAQGKWDASSIQLKIDATLTLPEEWADRKWTNEFTGSAFLLRDANVFAAALFKELPLSLFYCQLENSCLNKT